MKRQFFPFAFLLLYTAGYAQVNFPIVEAGKVWSIVAVGDAGEATTTAYKFENDTIINGVSYYMIYHCFHDSTLSNWRLDEYCFIREDALGNVFKLESPDESILYTFNLEPGDSIFTGYQIGGHDLYAHVDTVDSILIHGDFRKRIVFDPWFQETWIEGIGSIHHTLYPFAKEYSTEHFDLLCLHEDGILIFQNEEWNDCYVEIVGIAEKGKTDSYMTISPNPLRDQSVIEISDSEHKQNLLQLFNSSCEIVRTFSYSGNKCIIKKEGLPAGLYLIRLISESFMHWERMIVE